MKKHLLTALFYSLILSACNEQVPEQADMEVQCQSVSQVTGLLNEAGISTGVGTGGRIELTPEGLRVLLLQGNMTLWQGANRVHRAKDMLNHARATLLPSINLSALIQSSASPSFLVSSVEMLLPFLLPSRWFDLYTQKNLTHAEEMAFLLAELNQFSSLYAMYLAFHTDSVARGFLVRDIQDAFTVERLVSYSYETGQATEADLDLARSQVLSAQNRLLKLEELLAEEAASIRYAMAICPDVDLALADHDLPPSPLEVLPAVEATAQALRKAPESLQLSYLVRAAEMERFSKIFGIFSGASMFGMPSQSEDAFGNLNPQGRVGIGFGYVTAISLSNRNIEEMRIRQKSIHAETLKLLDGTLAKGDLVAQRIENALTSEALLLTVFEAAKQRYTNGEMTLVSLNDTQAKLRQARLDTIRAQFDQKLLRLTLHRLMRTEEFEKVKGCQGSVQEGSLNPCDSDFVKAKLAQR